MGTWVAVVIGLFVLGSITALKPSGIDVRLDKLRMTARRLELNPKLIACPNWIRGRDNEFGKGMMGQYALILDGMKLPETRYQVIDGQLRPLTNNLDIGNQDVGDSNLPNLDNSSAYNASLSNGSNNSSENSETQNLSYLEQGQPQKLTIPKNQNPIYNSTYTNDTHDNTDLKSRVNFNLDREPLNLPETIAPFVKAVYTKANSLVVFWDDSSYVKPNTNPHYDQRQIEPDLLALKTRMADWAEIVATKSSH